MVVHETALRATTYGKEPTEIHARIAEYARSDRIKRAFRRFLPIFGVGCVLLFLPPHVVWLTLFTIAACVLGIQRFRQKTEILELSGTCPDCAQAQTLAPPDSLPAIQRCPGCGAFLKLEVVGPAPQG